MSAIKIENVSYSYPQKDAPALRNINLELSHGEFVGVTGLKGAGKTTLLQL
jgi:ABC-type bacteriocin/lantibiotic exporter with double-glycine peptidase domain